MSVLWEWNGVDATQLDAAAIAGDPGAGELDPADLTLTVENNADAIGGKVLRFAAAGSFALSFSGDRGAAWLVRADEVELPARYIIEANIVGMGGSTGRYGGLAFLFDPDHVDGPYGHALHCAGEEIITRWEAGARASWDSNYATLALAGGLVRLDVRTDFTASTPRFHVDGRGINRILQAGTPQLVGSQWDHALIAGGLGAAYGAGWATATPNRFGLSLYPVSGSGTEDYLDVAELRILDPLADGGDPTPPTVTISPASGSVLAPSDVVEVNATHAAGLTFVVLLAEFADGRYEVIHDGTSFAAAYALSTRSAITDGYQYLVRRTRGWDGAVDVKAHAIAGGALDG